MARWPLGGKVVFITGAASGIGAAGAVELARRGATVVLADIDLLGLQTTAARVTPLPDLIELDVTDASACQDAVARTLARSGKIDAVWANAGIASIGPVHLSDPALWRRTIEVNLLGAYNTVRAALPAVIDAQGYVAVTASMASFGHPPHMSAYSTSKAGVEAMCNSMRIELAAHGVAVGSIHPTWIDTDMVREGDKDFPSFRILRAVARPPLRKTYAADEAARIIVDGFERRSRRICVPPFLRAVHALRPLLTTRLFERDYLAIAPEMEQAFLESAAARGASAASASRRVSSQLRREADY